MHNSAHTVLVLSTLALAGPVLAQDDAKSKFQFVPGPPPAPSATATATATATSTVQSIPTLPSKQLPVPSNTLPVPSKQYPVPQAPTMQTTLLVRPHTLLSR
jgi:hypothetical protein